jgi:uncharacterized Zn finger protein
MTTIADWLDEKTLLDLVPPDVFVRGAEEAEHGKVHIIEFSDVLLRARVEHADVHDTEFRLRDGQLLWACSCGEAVEHPCHHLMASAFATWPGETPDEE